MLIFSGLRYFIFPVALRAKGQPTSFESLTPHVMSGWKGFCKVFGNSALFVHKAHWLPNITHFLSWGSEVLNFILCLGSFLFSYATVPEKDILKSFNTAFN